MEEPVGVEETGGGVVALGTEPRPQPTDSEPGRGRESVDRVGELGQRYIPGLVLIGWGLTYPAETDGGSTEKNRDIENRMVEQ